MGFRAAQIMSTKPHIEPDGAAVRDGYRYPPGAFVWRTVCSVCRRKGQDTLMGDLYVTPSGFKWSRTSGRMGASERRKMGVFRVYPGDGVLSSHPLFYGRWGGGKTLTEADMPLRLRCQEGHHLNVRDVQVMTRIIGEADGAQRNEVVIPE